MTCQHMVFSCKAACIHFQMVYTVGARSDLNADRALFRGQIREDHARRKC